jgi:hypothetical protein
MGVGKISVW